MDSIKKLYNECLKNQESLEENKFIEMFEKNKKDIVNLTNQVANFSKDEIRSYIKLIQLICKNLMNIRMYNASFEIFTKVQELLPDTFWNEKNEMLYEQLSIIVKLTKFLPKYVDHKKKIINPNDDKVIERIKFYDLCYYLKINGFKNINSDDDVIFNYLYERLNTYNNSEFMLERFILDWSNEMIFKYNSREVNKYYLLDKKYKGNYSFKEKDDYIDIVFISADFWNRPTGQLLNSFFSNDRENHYKFSLIQFGSPKKDAIYKNLFKISDKYIIVDSTLDAIQKIKDIQPDIIVDLMGLMPNNVLPIMSLRLAPIQLSWLTYPSTLGLDTIDYMIADKHVVKEGQDKYYCEKLIYLPDTYQINDDRLNYHRYSSFNFGKEYEGKPDNCIYMGYFNMAYKIDTYSLTVWSEVLMNNPNTKLVLGSFTNQMSFENVAEFLKNSGVDFRQIVIWPRIEKERYLERMKRYIDICLDTKYCNGHTTTTDILSAGIPLITIVHDTFAGQVSESLLNSINCPELVTYEGTEYYQKIVELVSNPEKLKSIKEKVRYEIRKSNLFNSKRYFEHFLKSIDVVYDNYYNHIPKKSIHIEPILEYKDYELPKNNNINLSIKCSHSTLKLLDDQNFEILINEPSHEIWLNKNLVSSENVSKITNFPDGNKNPYRITIRKNKKTKIFSILLCDQLIGKVDNISKKLECNGNLIVK